MNSSSLTRPWWYNALRKALLCFAVIGALVSIWLLVRISGLLTQSIVSLVDMILGGVLFVIGLPVSAVLRVDELQYRFNFTGVEGYLLVATLIVMLNFCLMGVLIGGFRELKRMAVGSEGDEEEDAP